MKIKQGLFVIVYKTKNRRRRRRKQKIDTTERKGKITKKKLCKANEKRKVLKRVIFSNKK